jgi:hypothetical protein
VRKRIIGPVTGGAVAPGRESQPVTASWRPNPGATALAGKRSPKSICGSYNRSRAASAHPRPGRSPVAPLPPGGRRNRCPHPDAQTPAPPPSPGNAPQSRFAGRTTGPGPPAPTRGRAGHRWRRCPRAGVATGGRILAPKPRRHRPLRETLPKVDLRVVQPVPGRQRPPEAGPVTGAFWSTPCTVFVSVRKSRTSPPRSMDFSSL